MINCNETESHNERDHIINRPRFGHEQEYTKYNMPR